MSLLSLRTFIDSLSQSEIKSLYSLLFASFSTFNFMSCFSYPAILSYPATSTVVFLHILNLKYVQTLSLFYLCFVLTGTLLPQTHMVYSLTSLGALLKCHLLRQAFFQQYSYHLSAIFYCVLVLLTLTIKRIIYLLDFLSLLEYKIHESRPCQFQFDHTLSPRPGSCLQPS